MKNKFAIVLSVIIVILIFSFQPLYADVGYIDPSIGNTGDGSITAATNIANLIWRTLVIVLQVAAIAAVVIAGVRYMFSSANTKADIKNQTCTLILGATLTFCTTTVIEFLVKVVKSVL